MADALLKKINALLAKAEQAATQPEAEAYTAKAAELMARHGIEKHMLAAAAAAADKAKKLRPEEVRVDIDRPFPHQRKQLLVRIGGALGLKPVIHHDPSDRPGQYREKLSVSLFGSDADITRARTLFTSTWLQANNLLARERVSGSARKQSWLLGWADSVGALLRAAEKAAVDGYETEHALEAGQRSAALVLRDWDETVAEFRQGRYPALVRASARSTSGNLYLHGWSAAQASADIGTRQALAGA